MFPPGHLAVSYFAIRPVLGREPTLWEFTALSLGTLLPAAGNVFLSLAHSITLNDKWTHSPLTLAILVALGLIAWRGKLPYHNLYLMTVMGWASHLGSDFLFDFALLYFNSSTNGLILIFCSYRCKNLGIKL